MELTHLSLFSGIGGLDLAAEMAGFETIGQCEFAEFPTKILEKHWPDVPRWGDIHVLSATEFIRTTGRNQVTCISGGFPCQPHSLAGKRKASLDERDLWPEMRRVICEIRPKWVVGENVRGLLTSEHGEFFRGILRDFSDMGYDVAWCLLRACDTGAIHSRERLAIIAHTLRYGLQGIQPKISRTKSVGMHNPTFWRQNQRATTERTGVAALLQNGTVENIQPFISGDVDVLSEAMDRDKALGNAVCPQQFYPVFKAIAELERTDEQSGKTKNEKD